MKKFLKKRQFEITEELSFFEDVFFKHYLNEEANKVERGPIQWGSVLTTVFIFGIVAVFVFAA